MSNRLQRIRNLRIWIFAVTGGMIFAICDRLGYMLEHYGSIWAISENPWHRTVFHRILLRLPVNVLAVLLLLLLTDWLAARRRVSAGGRAGRRTCISGIWDLLTKESCRFYLIWLLCFASFLPAFLGGYPGIFAADAPNQIGWTFSGWLTAHHPLVHTGILCGIFSLARGFGCSDNTAAAVYTVLQMAALSGIFAWIWRFLKEEEAPDWLQAGTVLFLCLFPFHGMMAVYTTKDTLFSGIFVLCVMRLYKMCTDPGNCFGSRRRLLADICCFGLLFLFRNNGFHTLLLCMPFLLFVLRRYWKKLCLLFAALFLIYQFYNGPFLKLVGAEPGNAREAYSVVMQTLGRTYAAGGDIRPEEMEIIRPVMEEETLAQYTPNLSDPIKNFFHTEAFEKNKVPFLKTWLTVGWRNKKIYVDAFLNTACAFWYPDTSQEYLEFVCFDIEKENPAYPHVSMTKPVPVFYNYYAAIGTDTAFRRLPVVRELLSMGIYTWLMIFAALYACYKKEYGKLLWMLPFWSYLFTCLLGPAALLRYAYPVMLGAPLLVFMMQKTSSRSRES